MKEFITRRHFIKYLLSNATLLTIGNVAFSGQLKWPSSKTICPVCHFPFDFIEQNNFFDSVAWVDSFCPNCGVNLRTQKHTIKCDQYFRCRHEKLLTKEKKRNSRSECEVCWNIPFRAEENWRSNEKPWINLNDLNF
jgi:hypothetical protein